MGFKLKSFVKIAVGVALVVGTGGAGAGLLGLSTAAGGAIAAGLGISGLAASALGLVAGLVGTSLLTSGLTGKGSSFGADQSVQDALGTRQLTGANTSNKLPWVVGGDDSGTFISGQITDVVWSTDNQTAWYVIALSEVGSNQTFTFDTTNIFWADKRVTFDSTDLTRVTTLTDNAGNTDGRINNELFIYLYPNGAAVPGQNTGMTAQQVMQDSNIPMANRWPATNTMSNTCFAIIKIIYNSTDGTTGLQPPTFRLRSNYYKAGDIWYEYLTNRVFGCGFDSNIVDTASRDALNTYGDQLITFTPASGGSATQARYRLNGVIDTKQSLRQNIDNIMSACDCWNRWDEVAGLWKVTINQAQASVMSFNDSNVIDNFEFSPKLMGDTYTSVEVSFPDGLIRDQQNNAYLEVPDNLRSRGQPDNQLNLSLLYVNDNVRAQYLANRILEQNQEDLFLTFNSPFNAVALEAGDVIDISNDFFGWTNKLFRVSQVTEIMDDAKGLYARISCFEYNAAVYDDQNITAFQPSPNTGIPDPSFFGNLIAPTVVNPMPNIAIPSFMLSGTVPLGGICNQLDFYVSSTNSPLNATLLISAPNALGATYPPATVVTRTITGLGPGMYYFFTQAKNASGTSAFSVPSLIFAWAPNPSGSVSGVAANPEFVPPVLLVPTNSQGLMPVTGQISSLFLYIGTMLANYSTSPDDAGMANGTWRISGTTTSTGLTVTGPVASAQEATYTVTNLTAQTSTLTANLRYKDSTGTVSGIGDAVLQVLQSRSGAQGNAGATAFLNVNLIEFRQMIDGTWPVASQTMTYTIIVGASSISKSQSVSVDTSGNIVFATPTGDASITVATTGAGTRSGSINFTQASSGLNITGFVNSFAVSGLNFSSAPAQVTFVQNNTGTYTPETQNITATVTNGTTMLTRLVTATVASNGFITLANVSGDASITTSFVGNNSKVAAVMFTHTPSGLTAGSSAVSQIYPVSATDNFGGATISVNGVVTNTIAAPVALSQTYSNSNTFTKAANGGVWTPTPVMDIITSSNTITASRQGVLLARIIRVYTYNTLTGAWTDTADTSMDLNPTRFTLGAAMSSVSQYSRTLSYTDTDGSANDIIQLNVIVGGARGAPGPANVVRYGRFDSNAQAFVTGPPTTANGVDNINWFRSPSVFPPALPYTHTTSQFVNDVTAGSPYQETEVLSGMGGGQYLPAQNEIYTETITPGHVASTTANQVTRFAITGNSQITFNNLYSVVIAIGNGIAVMSGENPAYSSDGINWSPLLYASNGQPLDQVGQVVFANNIFVAVVNRNSIFTSTDGISYSPTNFLYQNSVSTINFANNLWLATFYGGAAYSTNLQTWTESVGLPSTNNSESAFGANTWVVGTSSGIYSSTNGGVSFTQTVNTTSANTVRFGNNLFVAGANVPYYSTNGINWTASTYPGTTGAYTYKIKYLNNIWWSCTNNGLYTSSNGITWTSVAAFSTLTVTNIYYANNNYIVITLFNLYYSTNGTSWNIISIPQKPVNISFSAPFETLAFGLVYFNNRFILTNYNYLPMYATVNPPATFNIFNQNFVTISSQIPYLTTLSTAILTYTKIITLANNLSTSATLGADYIAKMSVGKPDQLTFSLDASNNVQINYAVSGVTPTPTFTVTQSVGGSVNSTVVIGTPATTGVSIASSIVYNNVQQALNRVQYQLTSPPLITNGVYSWGVNTVSRVGGLVEGEAIVLDAQQMLTGPVLETSATYTTTMIPTGTQVLYNVNVYQSVDPASSTPRTFQNLTYLNGRYISLISVPASTGFTGNLFYGGLTTGITTRSFILPVGSGSGIPSGDQNYGIYNNGVYVIAATYFGGVMRSTDGVNWEFVQAYFENLNPPLLVSALAFGNNIYVWFTSSAIYVSSDALLWVKTFDFPISFPRLLKFGNGVFVAIDSLGFSGNTYRSTDGFTWTTTTTTGGLGFYNLTFGNGFFIASTATNIYRSTDGLSWTSVFVFPRTSNSNINPLGNYAQNRFLCSNRYDYFYVSTDNGITWQERFINVIPVDVSSSPVLRIFYGDGLWVASSGGYYATSLDLWSSSGNSISLIPASFPGITTGLQALTTGSYLFLQGTATTISQLTVLFSSGANTNQQAIDIATAFNTSEIAYTASANANVVTITSSDQLSYPDITHGTISPGSNGTLVAGDFTLVKVQDGRPPNTVSQGTRTTVTFTKAANYGMGTVTLTLDYGQMINGTSYSGNCFYSGTINGVATGNVVLESVSAYVAIQRTLNAMGYVVANVNATTLRVYDVDTTSGGNLTISVVNGTNPAGTFTIVSTIIDSGTIEIVVGDPNRWALPVNTGRQVS